MSRSTVFSSFRSEFCLDHQVNESKKYRWSPSALDCSLIRICQNPFRTNYLQWVSVLQLYTSAQYRSHQTFEPICSSSWFCRRSLIWCREISSVVWSTCRVSYLPWKIFFLCSQRQLPAHAAPYLCSYVPLETFLLENILLNVFLAKEPRQSLFHRLAHNSFLMYGKAFLQFVLRIIVFLNHLEVAFFANGTSFTESC